MKYYYQTDENFKPSDAIYHEGICFFVTLLEKKLTILGNIPLQYVLQKEKSRIPKKLLLAIDSINGRSSIEFLLALKEELDIISKQRYQITINDNFNDPKPHYLSSNTLSLIKELCPYVKTSKTNSALFKTSKKYPSDSILDIHGNKKLVLEELEGNKEVILPEEMIEPKSLQEILEQEETIKKNKLAKQLQKEGYKKEYIDLFQESITGYKNNQLTILTKRKTL